MTKFSHVIRMICRRIKSEQFILFQFLVNVHSNQDIRSDKPDRKISSASSDYPMLKCISLCEKTKKNSCHQTFLKYIYLERAAFQNFFCCLKKKYKVSQFLKNKLLVTFEDFSMLWSWLLLRLRLPLTPRATGRKQTSSILPVSGLRNLTLIEQQENINSFKISSILNTCFSTSCESLQNN